VAKKRRPARSTRKASSARTPGKRKAPAKKRPTKRPTGKPASRSVTTGPSLNLKELRNQVALAVSALSLRRASSVAGESKLDDTRRRLSQWMTDIDEICTPEEEEICGPSMDLPLP
jgi:hypothetical protein